MTEVLPPAKSLRDVQGTVLWSLGELPVLLLLGAYPMLHAARTA